MSDHDIAFWGMIASWFAAISTTAALVVALVVYIHGRYRQDRDLADNFITRLRMDAFVGRDPANVLVINAVNANSGDITIPIALVPREDGVLGYRQVRLFAELSGALHAGAQVSRKLAVADALQTQAKTLVHFRDARNRYWLRYVASGKYVHFVQRWRLLKRLWKNSGESGDLEADWSSTNPM